MASSIRDVLARCLAASGISQAELARRIKRDPSVVSHILRGDDGASGEVIERWMTATGHELCALPSTATALTSAVESVDADTIALLAEVASLAARGDPYLLGEVRGTLRALVGVARSGSQTAAS